MFVLIAREARPDAPGWPGRRALALVDALAWPVVWALLAWHAPMPGALIWLVTAFAVLIAPLRAYTALFANHRYWFTTWLWARVLALLMLIAIVLKVAMSL